MFVESISDVTVVQWGVVIGASLAAAIWDLRSRRIPNALTAPLAVTGALYALSLEGLGGLGQAVAASVLLALPYVLLFIFAGGGAGDAKMMGAIGAWLGLSAGVAVLLAVATTGAAIGLVNMAARRQLLAGLRRIGTSLYVMMVALCSGRKGLAVLAIDPEQESPPQDQRLAIPYGPAIFIGVCIGAFWVHSWTG